MAKQKSNNIKLSIFEIFQLGFARISSFCKGFDPLVNLKSLEHQLINKIKVKLIREMLHTLILKGKVFLSNFLIQSSHLKIL